MQTRSCPSNSAAVIVLPAGTLAVVAAPIGAGLATRPALEVWQQRHLLAAGAGQPLQLATLFLKLCHVLEAAVDGGEAHVGNLVQLAEFLHDHLTEQARGDLPLAQGAQPVDDMADGLLQRLGAHRPLLQRPRQTAAELLLVEGLAALVALDDARHHQLGGLEGGEALTAVLALAPAADLPAFRSEPGVDHLGLGVSAEGAVHGGALRVSARALARALARILARASAGASAVDREPFADLEHLPAHRVDAALVRDVLEHVGDPVRQLPALGVAETAGGDRRR